MRHRHAVPSVQEVIHEHFPVTVQAVRSLGDEHEVGVEDVRVFHPVAASAQPVVDKSGRVFSRVVGGVGGRGMLKRQKS